MYAGAPFYDKKELDEKGKTMYDDMVTKCNYFGKIRSHFIRSGLWMTH